MYLPSRDSSLLDLIMNALGSVVGAMVGLTLSPHGIETTQPPATSIELVARPARF